MGKNAELERIKARLLGYDLNDRRLGCDMCVFHGRGVNCPAKGPYWSKQLPHNCEHFELKPDHETFKRP